MKKWILGLGVFLCLASQVRADPSWVASHPTGIVKLATIVNPIRGRGLWVSKDIKWLEEQYRPIADNNLAASWLLQYDVLLDRELVDEIKGFDNKQELGLWLEISQTLAKSAEVLYPWGKPWYSPDVVFLSGYTRSERKKMIDEVFGKFKENFGNYPRSVGTWWIDNWSMNYMEEKYGIKAVMIVADQKTTDNYGVWGQWWGAPYRASKYNILVPGEGPVVIQWALRDPERPIGEGPEFSNYSLQANDYQERGLDIKYFEELAEKYLGTTGQITVGLEVGMEGAKNLEEYKRQIEWVAKNSQAVTMNEFGENFGQPESVKIDNWEMDMVGRKNSKTGEKIEYKDNITFGDYFVADKSSFLERIMPIKNINKRYIPYWLIVLVILNLKFLILKQFKIFNLLIINLFLWLAFGLILRSKYQLGWEVFYGPTVNNLGLVQILIVAGVMGGFWVMRKKKWLTYTPLVFGVEPILKAIRYTNMGGEKIVGITKGVYRLMGIGWNGGLKLINKDLANFEVESLLKINLNYWQWLVVDIVMGGATLFLINKLPTKWKRAGVGVMVGLVIIKLVMIMIIEPTGVKVI